jgi:ribosomal protein S18 acetylase RimI-like enzyme
MNLTFRELQPEDFDEMLPLWRVSEGILVGDSDTEERVTRFLERNPGLSLVAHDGTVLVGTALCGHDGRRGYIYKVAVLDAYRRRGVGLELVRRCMAKLRSEEIVKCHLFVAADNEGALEFWESTGWTRRADLEMFSKLTDPEV